MQSHRPSSTEPLRRVLAELCPAELLRRIASVDYGRGEEDILAEFTLNLSTGQYDWSGEGNPYECCSLVMHSEEPREVIFAAWWIGTFCSNTPEEFVLIDNLGNFGAGTLLRSLVKACFAMGHDSKRIAHGALPFVAALAQRDPRPDDSYVRASRALEAIETLGPDAIHADRFRGFVNVWSND